MTKQIKKLTTIFAVMALTMFAVFGEIKVTEVEVESHMLKCHSTQMNADVFVPVGSEKDIHLMDQVWDEVALEDVPGFKKTEKTIQFDQVCEDALKLLEPSNSFYVAVNGPEYKESSRVWKGTNGKYYQKRVSWTKIEE